MLALNEPLVPTEKDVLLAQEFQRQMGGLKFGKKQSIGFQIEGRPVSVPVAAARLLLDALASMAEGRTLTVVPLDEEVSPQEAAELLNVSRPYAARLFDKGAIPSRKVGTHRRALTRDVLAYRQREKEARLKVLDELAAEGQQLNMGY
ncbi:MAG TPA: helix-turn-helix domain-containing protein [Candidatus Saccharimonadia bacterium]|nr:helix-turn-helix domain-containing protein [Candidatus Saccharimonadia bacterium]